MPGVTSSGSPSRFRNALPTLLLGVLAIWFGLAECVVPIGLDQGILCYVARDILDGGVPYLTTWDHKPPGAHLMVTLAFAVLGDSATSLRLFDLGYILGNIYFELIDLFAFGDDAVDGVEQFVEGDKAVNIRFDRLGHLLGESQVLNGGFMLFRK